MHVPLILAGVLLVGCTGLAIADDEGTSAAFEACMAASNGVTLNMLDCMDSEIAEQDARLNNAYRAAMAGLEGDLKNQLRAAQRLWMQYRDAECTLQGSLTGGSIDRINGGTCMLNMTRERANQLQQLSAVD